jgi:hypothetical protein
MPSGSERAGDYRVRIALDGQGRETLFLDLLTQPGAAGPERLGERLREETGLGFEVTVSEDSSKWWLETTGEAAKARRWVDERMK